MMSEDSHMKELVREGEYQRCSVKDCVRSSEQHRIYKICLAKEAPVAWNVAYLLVVWRGLLQ